MIIFVTVWQVHCHTVNKPQDEKESGRLVLETELDISVTELKTV